MCPRGGEAGGSGAGAPAARAIRLALGPESRYAHRVRRNATLITLLASEAGVAAFALFFQLHARPSVLRAFTEFDTQLPPAAALALAPWFLPAALAVAAVSTAIALVAPLRRSRRPIVVSAGLVVLSFALIFAVWAAFMPIFQPG